MPAADRAVSSTELRRRLGAVGFEVTAEQSSALESFVDLLLRWNAVHNLTGVRGADEVIDRHLVESFALRALIKGTHVAEVGLKNTSVAHSRAEDLHVERPFDTVLARAVAPPAELLNVCRHLTAPGSVLLLLTAAHLEGAFRGFAPDFVARPVLKVGPVLRSTIVLLERIDA